MKRALIIIGATLAGLYALGLVVGPPAPPPTLAERCAREFSGDTTAARECVAILAYREAAADRRAKLERASR